MSTGQAIFAVSTGQAIFAASGTGQAIFAVSTGQGIFAVPTGQGIIAATDHLKHLCCDRPAHSKAYQTPVRQTTVPPHLVRSILSSVTVQMARGQRAHIPHSGTGGEISVAMTE